MSLHTASGAWTLRLRPVLELSGRHPEERSETRGRKAICSHVASTPLVSSQIIREAPGVSSIQGRNLGLPPPDNAATAVQGPVLVWPGCAASSGLAPSGLGSLSRTPQLSGLTPALSASK